MLHACPASLGSCCITGGAERYLVKGRVQLQKRGAAQDSMGKKRSAGVGPRRPFERLPDDIVQRILAQAAELNGCPPNKGFAQIQRLCQLRTVCSRFDRLVPCTERLLCRNANHTAQLVLFLQDTQAVKAICINAGPLPQLSLQALLGAAPHVQSLVIVDGFFYIHNDAQIPGNHVQNLHDLFRFLSMRHQLKELELKESAVPFHGALSSRHTLSNLNSLTLDDIGVDAVCLASILKACSSLTALVVRQAEGLRNTAIALGSLTTLDFDMSRELSAAASLEIQAPQLLHLTVTSVNRVTVNAPNLLALELYYTSEIRILSPWKVRTIKIEDGPHPFGKLMEVLNSCSSATEVTLRRCLPALPQLSTDRAMLSSLLRPLKQLETLTLSSVVPACVLEEQEADLTLAHLKSLEIGFKRLGGISALCSTFIKLSRQLEKFVIDLTTVVQGEVAVDDLVGLVLSLQRSHPRLTLIVKWPERCVI